MMRKLGSAPNEVELRTMIKRVDVDGDGAINFPEFLSLMAK